MRLLIRLGVGKLGWLTLPLSTKSLLPGGLLLAWRRIPRVCFWNRVHCHLKNGLWCRSGSQVQNLAMHAAMSCHCHCVKRICIWCVYNIVRSQRTEIVIFDFIWIWQPDSFCHRRSKRRNLPSRHRVFWVHQHPCAKVRARTFISS